MSSSEEQEGPQGRPAQEPTDRWLGARGPGHIDVGVQYIIQGNGDISTSWQVDASKAIPSKLPMFMYRSASPLALCMQPGWANVLALVCVY